ncbi:Na+/H+ antiporter NhaA [Escherichia coli]|uniref:Na+/H+ antiporter NhaA n=1 Tax=Escherichia coli TaxID=562 RepID=UPI0033158005
MLGWRSEGSPAHGLYSHGIDWIALAGAAGTVLILFTLNRRGVVALWPYLLGFVGLWWLVLLSGVHATVAGVITAALIPVATSPGAPDAAHSPLHRLEHALSPWGAFGIVPLFAFANAGVSLLGVSTATLGDPLVRRRPRRPATGRRRTAPGRARGWSGQRAGRRGCGKPRASRCGSRREYSPSGRSGRG